MGRGRERLHERTSTGATEQPILPDEKNFESPRDMTLARFLDEAASGRPTPGGGAVAALAAALAASMAEMTLNFTVGRARFAAAEGRARALLADAAAMRRRLLELVEADMKAYGAVSAAQKLPKASAEEKATRAAAIREATRTALAPPLETVRIARRLAPLVEEVFAIGNPNLCGDTAGAAALLPAAARAAAVNVWANLSSLDGAEASAVGAEVAECLERVDAACDAVYVRGEASLCPKKKSGSTSR